MTVDEHIAAVRAGTDGRTRFERQEPRRDEALVEEIERLRAAVMIIRLNAKNNYWGDVSAFVDSVLGDS